MCARMLAIFLLVGSSSFANAIDGFVSAGYGRSGTSLSDVTGGQDYNTQAGSGLFLTGGAILPISATTPHRFEAQLGVGYMFQDDARDESKTVSWSRIPLEAIYFYRNTQELFRFGWGPIFHFNNKITAKGANSAAATSVDNSLGWAVGVEKIFKTGDESSFWGLGLKYNFIKYHADAFSKEADGNCLFVTFSGLWF